MAKQVKVIDYRKLPSPDPKRLGKFDRMYVVEPEAGVRVVVRIPDETYSDEKLRDAIRKELTERGTEVSRTIEI